MSESTAEAAATETEVSTEQGPEEQKPTETVDFWKSKAREQERRAKENAGAAKRLADIEESQKSEAQKSADRIKQLESEAESARREALRFKVASKFGVNDEDADLFLTGSDEDTLTRQAERLSARSDERKKRNNVSPREGNNPQAKDNEERAMVRNLFGSDG